MIGSLHHSTEHRRTAHMHLLQARTCAAARMHTCAIIPPETRAAVQVRATSGRSLRPHFGAALVHAAAVKHSGHPMPFRAPHAI